MNSLECIDKGVVRNGKKGVERIENATIAKRLYVGEFAGSISVDQPQKEEVD